MSELRDKIVKTLIAFDGSAMFELAEHDLEKYGNRADRLMELLTPALPDGEAVAWREKAVRLIEKALLRNVDGPRSATARKAYRLKIANEVADALASPPPASGSEGAHPVFGKSVDAPRECFEALRSSDLNTTLHAKGD